MIPTMKQVMEMPTNSATFHNLRLIPYYSWSNRGQSQMTVWLPVTWK